MIGCHNRVQPSGYSPVVDSLTFEDFKSGAAYRAAQYLAYSYTRMCYTPWVNRHMIWDHISD